MNRRSFLAGLPFIPLAVKAVIAQPEVTIVRPDDMGWVQTTRVVKYRTAEYDDAIDRIVRQRFKEGRDNFFQRYGLTL